MKEQIDFLKSTFMFNDELDLKELYIVCSSCDACE
jgi:hypothetical protein